MLQDAGPGNENAISPLASLTAAGVPVTFGTDNVPVSLFYPIWQSVARKDLTTGQVVAEIEKSKSEFDPAPGEYLQELAAKVAATPKNVIDRTAEALHAK